MSVKSQNGNRALAVPLPVVHVRTMLDYFHFDSLLHEHKFQRWLHLSFEKKVTCISENQRNNLFALSLISIKCKTMGLKGFNRKFHNSYRGETIFSNFLKVGAKIKSFKIIFLQFCSAYKMCQKWHVNGTGTGDFGPKRTASCLKRRKMHYMVARFTHGTQQAKNFFKVR